MNAKEARQRAKEVNIASENSQYKEIKECISKAVEKGDYMCYYHESVKSDVSLKLENEGFDVADAFNQRDGTLVTITW